MLLVLRDNPFIISCIEAYVNNFFRKKLNNSYLQIKRRRRDLNPRAALTTYSLSRGAPSTAWVLLQYQALELSLCMKVSGERGIRTLAPFRTNGFQDRLVMTASISLQVIFVRRHQPATCTYYHFTIIVSTSFFKKFEAIFKSSGVVIFRFSYAPIITFVLTLL